MMWSYLLFLVVRCVAVRHIHKDVKCLFLLFSEVVNCIMLR